MERRTLTGAVTVGDDRVRVGELVIARRDVHRGVFEPGPPMQLILMTTQGELGLAVPDAETARAALRVLGVDVERKALRVQRISADKRRQYVLGVILLMGSVAGLFAEGFHVRAPALYLGLFALTILLSWFVGRARPPLEIGSDGVRVEGRFIPIEAIRSVVENPFGFEVIVKTTDGEVVIPMRDDDGAEQARVIAERIREAMSAQGSPKAESTVLDSKVENVSEWRESLVKMATAREDYRGVALERGEMLRVLDDPHAPLQRRIGAAIALHASGGDAAQRIRVCAEAIAEPHLRIALERIADGAADDELIQRALGARED